MSRQPDRWDEQVTDLRIEVLHDIADRRGFKPDTDPYDDLLDVVLSVTNDQMWQAIVTLGIGRETNGEWKLSGDEFQRLAGEIETAYVTGKD